MRTYAYTKYGPPEVLKVVELPKPKPEANEVLIKNYATTVSSGDWRARSLTAPAGMGWIMRLVFGVFGPRKQILGTEFSGVIEAIGADVGAYEVGQEVVAFPGGGSFGAYAEFVIMPENGKLAKKPPKLSFEEAAALCFGGTTAYDFLINKAGLEAGDEVLVNGASGSTGTACVQMAKHFGAEVTGVCSGRNEDLVRSIGADHIIDYKRCDFVEEGAQYDLIIDTVGTARWSKARQVLAPKGRLVVISGSMLDVIFGGLQARLSGRRVIGGVSSEAVHVVRKVVDIAAAGEFVPVIDRSYSFEQMIEAHQYVDSGRKKGNVVIRMHAK